MRLFSPLAACFFAISAAATSASTLNLSGGYEGGALGPVAFDFNIIGDFSSDIADTAIATSSINTLTSNGANLSLQTLSFSYDQAQDWIEINYESNTNSDSFSLLIGGFLASTNQFLFASDQDGTDVGCGGALVRCSIDSVLITSVSLETTPVPLPASLGLFLASLFGLGGWELRRREIA